MEGRGDIIARDHHSIYKKRKIGKERELADYEKQNITRLP